MVTEVIDIGEPIVHFRESLRPAVERRVTQGFDRLVAEAGVDVSANIATVAEVNGLNAQIKDVGADKSRLRTFRVLAIIAAVVAVIAALVLFPVGNPAAVIGGVLLLGVAVAAVLVITQRLTPQIRDQRERVAELTGQRDSAIQVGWNQLAPLNASYGWFTVPDIVASGDPVLRTEPFLTETRLNDLRLGHGWNDPVGDFSSVLQVITGDINGNPWLMVETLNHEMGWKTYTGFLVITWMEAERYRDSNGNWRTRMVQRSQTLTASVTKPFPEYDRNAFLVYGNVIAPEVNFTRQPSKLSGSNEGKMAQARLNRTVNKLEKKSRKMGTDFTVMSNRDFEALFHATDRDNETQFRVMFTPVAQEQMVSLLRDNQHGFGDNFHFLKSGNNIEIHSGQLQGMDLLANPAQFADWNLETARARFRDFTLHYSRALYFTLAPLLAIPALQEPRDGMPLADNDSTPAAWELEVAANHLGESRFANERSVTTNILKVEPLGPPGKDGAVPASVTASGYSGTDRIDSVPMRGGDGRIHRVPVPWVEYRPVKKTTKFTLKPIRQRNS